MDKEKLMAFYTDNGGPPEIVEDDTVFWGSVHKAITAIPSIPLEKRKESKKWLDEHNMTSWDDGEL